MGESSIFSDYLARIRKMQGKEVVYFKPSDVYARLRNTYNQGVKVIEQNVYIFLPFNYETGWDVYSIAEDIMFNKELHQVVKWINRKIVLPLDISDRRTIGVRLRIATGMLNKLVYENKVTAKFAAELHDNLVSNVNAELGRILTQDLPF